MVGDNKILTVSYGTFSCTLEGFDDPFSTMKNIAEYFRDLAAGDRFFGAEPPQPDPEMLQSIAEQTIKARVNAQLSDNGLVLRQDAASTPTHVPPMAAVAAAAMAPQVAPVAAPAAGVETVAEKLQRIRAVVSRETAQDALFSEDQHVDEFAVETTAPLSPVEDTPVFEAAVEEDSAPIETLQAERAEVPAEVEAVEETVTQDNTLDVEPTEDHQEASFEDTPADELIAETVAEEDVLSDIAPEASAEFEEEADTSADIDLSSIVSDTPSEDVSVEADSSEVSIEDTIAEDTVTEDTVVDDAAVEGSDETEDLDATSREDAAENAVDSVLGRVSDDEDAEAATPRRRIVVQKITREDLKAAREEAAKTAALKEETAAVETDTGTDTVADVDAELSSELPPEQEEELLRELAALQLDGSDAAAEMTFENDPSSEVAEQDPEDLTDGLAGILAASKDEDTSADDDLAEALSDLVQEDEEGYRKEEQTAAREVRRARRDAIITEGDEDDVERLLSTTSSRIDNDESSQRRASIAHLKAAVAATKADSSLADAAQEAEARERDQYAEDLARVVRPERKVATGDRAKTDRPAPLVLVSELRIDKDDEAEAPAEAPSSDDAPVRPRRISRAEIDDQETDASVSNFDDADQASFADYAASQNAMELPDLLEAAAAYYTFVESTEQFTRPMLMRKIASISERDGFSREAGLRSFGTLLREGKLVKGSDGKFVIAKSSRFTPEARYAGE